MKKVLIIGIIIGIVIIGLVASSLSSENIPDINEITDEVIEEPKSTGKSISIELKESVGMKATP